MFRGRIAVVLHVNDLKTSAEFYEYVLGFAFDGYLDAGGSQVSDWEDAPNPVAAEFRAGESNVTLQLDPDGNADGSAVEHVLEVINIDAFYRQVVERGGSPGELVVQPWGRKEFCLSDDNGHRWTFYKTLPTAAAGS